MCVFSISSNVNTVTGINSSMDVFLEKIIYYPKCFKIFDLNHMNYSVIVKLLPNNYVGWILNIPATDEVLYLIFSCS